MLIRSIEPASDAALARRLLSIQHAAYLVEAALIGDERIPALQEGLEDLRSAELQWLGAFDDDRLIGAAAWVESGDAVDIDRLVVSPSEHRRGAGRRLVRAVLRIAGGRRTTVTTGRGNMPALALYRQLGFDWTDDREVEAGLWVSHLAHHP